MLSGLFKPKWQHSNARVRIQALASLAADSTELIQLAQNDPNTGVRLEAIAYLNHLPTLIELGRRTDSIGERAKHRVIALAGDEQGHDARLAEVFEWLQGSPELVQQLARDSARGAELRKLAVAEIDDQGLLYTIASEDSSRDIQFLAASQITDVDKLRKLERQLGKTNKRLRQLLKERAALEQAEQARTAELTSLCMSLEGLGQSGHWAQDKTQLMVLQQSWKKYQDQAPIKEALEKRFHDAEREFQGRLDAYEQQQASIQPLRDVFETLLSEGQALQVSLDEQPEQQTVQSIDQVLEDLQSRWVAAESVPDDEVQAQLNERWVQVFVALTEKRDGLSSDLNALEQLTSVCVRAEKMRQQTKPLHTKAVTDLQAEWTQLKLPRQMQVAAADLEQRFKQAVNSLSARLQREATERAEKLAALQQELERLEQDIEQEKYGEAIDIYQQISADLKSLKGLPAAERSQLERRLQAVAPMVLEFKDWRRWGTDQAREHLIETAQRLENDDSIDPQQRAKEIHALRQEWRKLAKMEPGQQRKQWKDFDAKVSAAYEPSKQHFEQQAQQRALHLRQREGVCIQLESMLTAFDWEDPELDWHSVNHGINELRKSWKGCGTVGHKEWKAINQRFNNAMDALEEKLKVERERNLALRRQLVTAAEALTDLEDVQVATAEAKALQARWKITLPSRPREEQQLWRQFRAPIDQVFDQLKAQRQSHRSQTDEAIQARNEALEQLQAVLQSADADFSVQQAAVADLFARYEAAGTVPKAVHRKQEARLTEIRQAIQRRREQLQWQQRLATLDELAAKSQAAKQAEADEATLAANQQQGEQVCMQLEILLDLPSPPDVQQARMAYQVAQMSEAMRSRNDGPDSRSQALRQLGEWYQLGALPPAALDAQQARIDAVRQTISK